MSEFQYNFNYVNVICQVHLFGKHISIGIPLVLQPLLGAQVVLRQRLESKKGMI